MNKHNYVKGMKDTIKTIGVTLIGTLFVCMILMIATAAMALEQVGDTPTVSNTEFLSFLSLSIGGLKGASAIAIAYTLSQILMTFLKSEWGFSLSKNWSNKAKFVVYFLVALVAGLLTLVHIGGLSWGAAATHSTVVAFVGAGLYRIYELFFEKKD